MAAFLVAFCISLCNGTAFNLYSDLSNLRWIILKKFHLYLGNVLYRLKSGHFWTILDKNIHPPGRLSLYRMNWKPLPESAKKQERNRY